MTPARNWSPRAWGRHRIRGRRCRDDLALRGCHRAAGQLERRIPGQGDHRDARRDLLARARGDARVFIAPSPAAFNEVGAQRVQFADTASSRNPADSPAEAQALAQAVAANDGFCALFTRIQSPAPKTLARQVAVTAQLNAAAPTVLLPLGTLAGLQAQRADAAQASASSAETQAFWIVVTVFILAMALGIAFVFYAFTTQPCGRAGGRADGGAQAAEPALCSPAVDVGGAE